MPGERRGPGQCLGYRAAERRRYVQPPQAPLAVGAMARRGLAPRVVSSEELGATVVAATRPISHG
jgi:hypothetical protein